MNSTLKTPALPISFSNHNLTHTHAFTLDMGLEIPYSCMEMVPNDRFDISHDLFVRFAPMQYPPMSEINAKIFDFFIPMRILTKYWKQFMAEKPLNDNIEIPFIYLSDIYAAWDVKSFPREYEWQGDNWYFDGVTPSSLCDYLGIPVANFLTGRRQVHSLSSGNVVLHEVDPDKYASIEECTEKINIFPLLAYQMNHDRWFRDINLEDPMFSEDEDETFLAPYRFIDNTPQGRQVRTNLRYAFVEAKGYCGVQGEQIGSDEYYKRLAAIRALTYLRKKSWEKDYFTSALPTPQYGDPVPVPLEGNIMYDITYGDTATFVDRNGNPVNLTSMRLSLNDVNFDNSGRMSVVDPQSGEVIYLSINNAANLTAKNLNFTINDLRAASSVQRYQEVLMRVGHRYSDQIKALFSQIVPNSELDEPLLIGARTIPVQIDTVTQTSPSVGDDNVLGGYAGQANVYGNADKVRWHATDFGYYMSVISVLPRTVYQNGLPRMFSRFDRLDWFNPMFQRIGDQAVKNRELYMSPDVSQNDLNFGYSPRFADYKEQPSMVSGDFQTSLSFMVLSRNFRSLPPLNANFIHVDRQTVNRAFAVDLEGLNNLYAIVRSNVLARRPMEYNPLPQLL